MATSYRKLPPLEPKDILVFDKVPPPPQPNYTLDGTRLPELHTPTPLHDVSTLVEQLGKLGKLGKSRTLEPGASFTLSPRVAWLENRGFLDAWNVVIVAADQPTYQFINTVGPSDEGRNVAVWLRGLTPGHSYIAQVRVQAGTDGEFHISTGEGARQTAPGGDRTIPVLLSAVAGETSLVRIENHGAWFWAFVDVTITSIGQV